jgi:hypothetical protein
VGTSFCLIFGGVGEFTVRVLLFITRSRRKFVFSRNRVRVTRKICQVSRVMSSVPRKTPPISRNALEISKQ